MTTNQYIFTKEQQEEIIYLYRYLNWKQHEIAKKFNCSRKPIKRILGDTKRLFEDEQWLREQYEIHRLNKREIALKCHSNETTIRKYMKLYHIETDDTISRRRKYEQDDNFFEVIDTEEKAYWLGFIVADGCIHITQEGQKTGYNRLHIQLKEEDCHHLEKFLHSINGNSKIIHGKTFLKATQKSYGFCRLKVYSLKMINDLMALGVMPSKSTKEVMPTINEHLVRHFIRGLFDGDGCYSYWKCSDDKYSSTFSIVSSYEMICSLQKEFEKIGFKCRISKQGKIYSIATTSTKDSILLMEYLYQDATVFLDRKYYKFLEGKSLINS